jgi:Flp pilus assembly pilin Flp
VDQHRIRTRAYVFELQLSYRCKESLKSRYEFGFGSGIRGNAFAQSAVSGCHLRSEPIIMRTRTASFISLVQHDSAVTSIEYALIVGLIALALIGVLDDTGTTLSTFFATLSTRLAL